MDMNIDILPEELWCQILLELPCKLIIDMHYVSHKFKILCDKYDIINKRKMKGFPRKSGQCKAYDVTMLINNYKLKLKKMTIELKYLTMCWMCYIH